MPVTRRSFIARVAQTGGYGAAFSAMQALGLMAAPEPTPLENLPKDLGKGKKVVILGAGIAGMVAAYELRKAGFECTVLEARERPGGRNWTIRNGTNVEFTDGTVQRCEWQDGLYMNAGPARLPSIHRVMLGYCQELGVPLEVEVNTSRSTLMQSDELNGGRPVEQRQIVYDTRGHLAELFSKALGGGNLDSLLTKDDAERLLAFLQSYGDLKTDRTYRGTERAGFDIPRDGSTAMPTFRTPMGLHDLLVANFVKGEFYEDRLDWQATMFQPIGGMDRIAYRFAQNLGSMIHFRSVVKEIRRTEGGVRIVYSSPNQATHSVNADYCICTLPTAVLRGIPSDFSSAAKQAIAELPMYTLYKIAWQSPRFWERENNIYGGISFANQAVDLVWYPSDRLFSSHGVLIAGFNLETDETGKPTAFGKLGSMAAKLAASKMTVEKLHPGHSKDLTQPIYVPWASIPYSLGAYPNTHLESSQPAYNQLHQPEGNIFFASDYLSRIPGWQEGAALSAHGVVAQIASRVQVARAG